MQSRFTPQELYYRLNWRAHGIHASAHQIRNRGTGLDFCGYAPFLDYPNPRRLDLRASLRSIPRQYVVRSYYEHGAVNVYALVDMSSSMDYLGNTNKQKLVADISASIAWSANLSGDAFGLLASDDSIRSDLHIHPSRQVILPRKPSADSAMPASTTCKVQRLCHWRQDKSAIIGRWYS